MVVCPATSSRFSGRTVGRSGQRHPRRNLSTCLGTYLETYPFPVRWALFSCTHQVCSNVASLLFPLASTYQHIPLASPLQPRAYHITSHQCASASSLLARVCGTSLRRNISPSRDSPEAWPHLDLSLINTSPSLGPFFFSWSVFAAAASPYGGLPSARIVDAPNCSYCYMPSGSISHGTRSGSLFSLCPARITRSLCPDGATSPTGRLPRQQLLF